jgi:transposase
MPALTIRDDISLAELRRQARRERDGRISARLIALANALDGMDRATAARLAGMDRQTLRDWVHRYNAEGIVRWSNRPLPGRAAKLSEGQMAALTAIVLRGPDPAVAGVRRWRVMDLCRVAQERWGRQLQRDVAAVVVARPVAPQDPAAAPEDRRDGAERPSKGGFAARLSEIAAAHPRPSGWRSGARTRRGSGRRAAPVMCGGNAARSRAGCAISATNRPGSSAPCAQRATPAWRWSQVGQHVDDVDRFEPARYTNGQAFMGELVDDVEQADFAPSWVRSSRKS